jgi:hypothetical protein
MIEHSLKVLAGTTPKNTFRTYREAAEKITSLETALGLPASKPIVNIGRAAARIAELESMVAAKTAPVVAPVAPEKPATPPAPALHGRARFNASTTKDIAKIASPAKSTPQSHLTGAALFSASSAADVRAVAPIRTIAPDADGEKKLTGRAKFNAAVVKELKTLLPQ